jgi:hypothetical protein
MPVARAPYVAISFAISVMIPVPVAIVVDVDVDTRTAVIVMIMVVVPEIRVAIITMVIHMKVVAIPAEVVNAGDTPEKRAEKGVSDGVRVVIHRICPRVIVVNRLNLVHDNLLRLVVGHVNNIVINRIDFDNAVVVTDNLVFIRFQVARSIGAVAKAFDGGNRVRLLVYKCLAQLPGPVQILIEEPNDLGIIEQGNDRIVPLAVGLQSGICIQLVEEARRLDDLQRIAGGWQDDSQKVIGIQRDRPHEFIKLTGGKRNRGRHVAG